MIKFMISSFQLHFNNFAFVFSSPHDNCFRYQVLPGVVSCIPYLIIVDNLPASFVHGKFPTFFCIFAFVSERESRSVLSNSFQPH